MLLPPLQPCQLVFDSTYVDEMKLEQATLPSRWNVPYFVKKREFLNFTSDSSCVLEATSSLFVISPH